MSPIDFTSREIVTARIDDIAMCRRNPDPVSQANATANILAGLPAYWASSQGMRQDRASYLAALANYHGSLVWAFAEQEPFYSALPEGAVGLLLDCLIPLSRAAVDELGRIYRFRSMPRDPFELRLRERRAIMQPFWPDPPDGRDSRDLFELQYAKAQARFLAREKARKAVPAMAGAA